MGPRVFEVVHKRCPICLLWLNEEQRHRKADIELSLTETATGNTKFFWTFSVLSLYISLVGLHPFSLPIGSFHYMAKTSLLMTSTHFAFNNCRLRIQTDMLRLTSIISRTQFHQPFIDQVSIFGPMNMGKDRWHVRTWGHW